MTAPASAPAETGGQPAPDVAPPATAEFAPAGYGGFWKRVAASLIDGIVVGVPMMILLVLAGGSALATGEVTGALWGVYAVGLVVGIAYNVGLESSAWQATLGKRALRMRVVDASGNRLTPGRAFGRYFGKILSSLPLYVGFLMIGFTERKRGLHDMVAGTLVVNAPR